MARRELVIPRAAVEGLRCPPVSLTDGHPAEAEPVPSWRSSLFQRSRTIMLPFGSGSAGQIRRALTVQRLEVLLLGPARLIIVVVGMVAVLRAWRDSSFSLAPYAFILGALALQVFTSLLGRHVIPPQYPRQCKGGDLIIKEVPEEVAEAWVALNPQVRVYSPRD